MLSLICQGPALCELLFADDLGLMSETIEGLSMEVVEGMGLKVNLYILF